MVIGGPRRARNSNGWVSHSCSSSQTPKNATGAMAGAPGGQGSQGRRDASKGGLGLMFLRHNSHDYNPCPNGGGATCNNVLTSI